MNKWQMKQMSEIVGINKRQEGEKGAPPENEKAN